MGLKGVREFQRRLEAITHTFRPIGIEWADRTVAQSQRRVRKNTGRLRRSFREGETSDRRATVIAHYTAQFENAGAKPHPIKAKPGKRLKFMKQGRTVYAGAVRHPGMRGSHFAKPAAVTALRDTDMSGHMIGKWNGAA